MKNLLWNLLTVGAALSLVGCSSSQGQLPSASASLAQSRKPGRARRTWQRRT